MLEAGDVVKLLLEYGARLDMADVGAEIRSDHRLEAVGAK